MYDIIAEYGHTLRPVKAVDLAAIGRRPAALTTSYQDNAISKPVFHRLYLLTENAKPVSGGYKPLDDFGNLIRQGRLVGSKEAAGSL